ncbi:hypothetical protein ACOBQX_07390 [Actinokineospora sp. G85]|uniref:hypothetical protein n=1 Tax=Actinokineospora sp. G85 TaxID=3406626 RepID=UPI003C748DA4
MAEAGASVMAVVTPSGQVGAKACTRVFEGGFTFRLAKGDTHIAVFTGVCLEQRRAYVFVEREWPGKVIEGPRPFTLTLPKPTSLAWADTDALAMFARASLPAIRTFLTRAATR